MNLPQLLYALALQAVPNIGDISAKKLIQHCGSPEAVFKETKANLSKIDGIGTFTIKYLEEAKHLKAAEKELSFMEKKGIEGLYFEDSNYPFKLKHCIDGLLYCFKKVISIGIMRPLLVLLAPAKSPPMVLHNVKK